MNLERQYKLYKMGVPINEENSKILQFYDSELSKYTILSIDECPLFVNKKGRIIFELDRSSLWYYSNVFYNRFIRCLKNLTLDIHEKESFVANYFSIRYDFEILEVNPLPPRRKSTREYIKYKYFESLKN